MIGHVNKWGNSLGVRIPRAIAQQLGITKGSTVELFVKSGHELVILVAEKSLSEQSAEVVKETETASAL